MNIEGTIEIISNSAESFWTSGNIIAIFVALISILGSIFVAWRSEKNSKEISKSNNETQRKINDENLALKEKWNIETLQFQQKINQSNIDANLIATARIDWIQNVRKITAELITLINKCLTPLNKEVILEVTLQAKEKIELLILYFGNESIENTESRILDKTTDNKGKNQEIVKFLSLLSKKLTVNYEMVKNKKLDTLKKLQEQRLSEMQDYIIAWENNEVKDDEGNMHPSYEPIFKEDVDRKYDKTQKEILELVKQSRDLENDAFILRETIRLYLKIEWTIAKTGS